MVDETAPVLGTVTVTLPVPTAAIFAPDAIPVPEILSPTLIPDVEATEITVAADADVADAVVPEVARSAPVF